MGFITNLFGNIDFQVILQLLCVALIMISGPVIIFLLYLRGGDL
ncbi:MAG: photosystem II reaction center protein Ycf12 [Cyanobacteria bacterium J083]|nr:MAG: photosystem II reaction center protein Ycf12 [Cyanobacteria bacterium J083]